MTPPTRDTATSIPEVFTVDEAAVILRVTKSWLERKAAARRIPFSMLGGSYHFSPDHLRWIISAYEKAPTVSAEPAMQPATTVRRKKRVPAESADPRVVPLRPRPRRSRRQNEEAA